MTKEEHEEIVNKESTPQEREAKKMTWTVISIDRSTDGNGEGGI